MTATYGCGLLKTDAISETLDQSVCHRPHKSHSPVSRPPTLYDLIAIGPDCVWRRRINRLIPLCLYRAKRRQCPDRTDPLAVANRLHYTATTSADDFCAHDNECSHSRVFIPRPSPSHKIYRLTWLVCNGRTLDL